MISAILRIVISFKTFQTCVQWLVKPILKFSDFEWVFIFSELNFAVVIAFDAFFGSWDE